MITLKVFLVLNYEEELSDEMLAEKKHIFQEETELYLKSTKFHELLDETSPIKVEMVDSIDNADLILVSLTENLSDDSFTDCILKTFGSIEKFIAHISLADNPSIAVDTGSYETSIEKNNFSNFLNYTIFKIDFYGLYEPYTYYKRQDVPGCSGYAKHKYVKASDVGNTYERVIESPIEEVLLVHILQVLMKKKQRQGSRTNQTGSFEFQSRRRKV